MCLLIGALNIQNAWSLNLFHNSTVFSEFKPTSCIAYVCIWWWIMIRIEKSQWNPPVIDNDLFHLLCGYGIGMWCFDLLLFYFSCLVLMHPQIGCYLVSEAVMNFPFCTGSVSVLAYAILNSHWLMWPSYACRIWDVLCCHVIFLGWDFL